MRFFSSSRNLESNQGRRKRRKNRFEFRHDVYVAHARSVFKDELVEAVQGSGHIVILRNVSEILNCATSCILNKFISALIIKKQLFPELKSVALYISSQSHSAGVEAITEETDDKCI